jgi:hypothetical protein
LRKLARLICACTVVVCGNFATAQQIDLAVAGSTLFSSKPTNASLAFPPPAEKGGVYPGASVDFIRTDHFGLNAEFAYRYKESLYNGYQRFRPFLYDFNGVFTHKIDKRISADFLAGFGGESLIFYNRFVVCSPIYSGDCPTSFSGTHFLLHLGGGVRYYFWRRFFARPEAHYYYIVGNTDQFHSGNVLRLGASIGYTFGVK